jgi:hypothetical protein
MSVMFQKELNVPNRPLPMNKAKKLLKSESVDDILFIGEVGLS